ncbi:MAG: NADH-quinone oxidoreductase subunit C [bacterium]
MSTNYHYSYETIEELLELAAAQASAGQKPTDQPAAGAANEAAAHPVTIGRSQVQSSDLAFVTVSPEAARHLIIDLRDRFGFTHLVFLTAVDYIEEDKFLLTYLLHNYVKHMDIGVQVPIGRDNASMESIHDLWAQAGTYQRELKEMFGIDFPGSPRVDEPFILEGWNDVPPMRREFDTKQYSETTYFPRPGRSTSDPADYMRRKLYPKE